MFNFFSAENRRDVYFLTRFLQCMFCGVNKTVYYCFQWMILLNQNEYIVNKFLADFRQSVLDFKDQLI